MWPHILHMVVLLHSGTLVSPSLYDTHNYLIPGSMVFNIKDEPAKAKDDNGMEIDATKVPKGKVLLYKKDCEEKVLFAGKEGKKGKKNPKQAQQIVVHLCLPVPLHLKSQWSSYSSFWRLR